MKPGYLYKFTRNYCLHDYNKKNLKTYDFWKNISHNNVFLCLKVYRHVGYSGTEAAAALIFFNNQTYRVNLDTPSFFKEIKTKNNENNN